MKSLDLSRTKISQVDVLSAVGEVHLWRWQHCFVHTVVEVSASAMKKEVIDETTGQVLCVDRQPRSAGVTYSMVLPCGFGAGCGAERALSRIKSLMLSGTFLGRR